LVSDLHRARAWCSDGDGLVSGSLVGAPDASWGGRRVGGFCRTPKYAARGVGAWQKFS
jgi:hypothetical protein